MANGRITVKDLWAVLGDIQCKVGEIRGETKSMANDLNQVKNTLQDHTDKLGILKGKAAVWGVIGGGGITVIGGVIIYFLTNGFRGPIP